ncbi:MAG: hypothetical protein KKD28_03850 [Chloroflexi bacterium]|nr:hypothetical protein [Chloroflexota bacterium]
MKSRDGKRTEEFGLWLTRYLRGDSQYFVFYDHGIKQEDQNVAAIKGFYGHQVANKNRLADIDVMVVNNDTDEVILLIEVEERGMPPKKLLGDVFATLMCNRFAVRIDKEQKYFNISPETRLIVCGVVPGQGDGQDKIINVITPRLREFGVPDDTIQIDKIKFVFGEDISGMIEELKSETKNVFAIN